MSSATVGKDRVSESPRHGKPMVSACLMDTQIWWPPSSACKEGEYSTKKQWLPPASPSGKKLRHPPPQPSSCSQKTQSPPASYVPVTSPAAAPALELRDSDSVGE